MKFLWRPCFALLAALIIVAPLIAQNQDFRLQHHSSLSLTTPPRPELTLGYARIQASSRTGSTGLPAGMAVISNRQQGVLVSEASIPVASLISAGRIYAALEDSVATGIALANPNSSAVTIDFYFTDSDGKRFGEGSTTITADHQIAAFLSEFPFNAVRNRAATFSFTSSQLVSAAALRVLTNERSEVLMTTQPVGPIGELSAAVVTIPQIPDGGGWSTAITLVNPTESEISGELRPYDPDPIFL